MKKLHKIINYKLGDNLSLDIVIKNGKAELQAMFNLFTLGDNKSFPVSLLISKEKISQSGEFGYGSFFAHNFSIECFTENFGTFNKYILLKDKFDNEEYFYNVDSNSNIYINLHGDRKIEKSNLNGNTIYKIINNSDDVYEITYNSSNQLISKNYSFHSSFKYDIYNDKISSFLQGCDGPYASFTYNGAVISQIIYYQTSYKENISGQLNEYINFEYTSNKLSKITFNYLNGIKSTYELSLNDNEWEFKHIETNKYFYICFGTNNEIIYFKADFNNEENSIYENDFYYGLNSVVLFNQNFYNYYHFDKDGNLDFEFDNNGYFQSQKSNKIYKEFKIIQKSNTFLFNKNNVTSYNLLTNDLNNSIINNWHIVQGPINPVFSSEITAIPQYFEPFCSDYATIFEVSQAVSESVFYTDVESNFTNNNFVFSGIIETNYIYQENSGYIKITPYFNNEIAGEDQIYDINLGSAGETNIFLENLHFNNSVNKIRISFVFYRGTKIRLRSFKLIKASYGVEYKFDDNNMVSKIIKGNQIIRIKNHSGHINKVQYKDYNSLFSDEYLNEDDDEYIKKTYLNSKTIRTQKRTTNGKFLIEDELKYEGLTQFIDKTTYTYHNSTKLVLSEENDCAPNKEFIYLSNTNLPTTLSLGDNKVIKNYSNLKVQNNFKKGNNATTLYGNTTNYSEKGLITNINDGYFTTNFAYNSYCDLTLANYNGVAIEQTSYKDAKLEATTLVNAKAINNATSVFNYSYNNEDKITLLSNSQGPLFSFTYNNLKEVSRIQNIKAQVNYNFSYDFYGNIRLYQNDNFIFSNVFDDNQLIHCEYNYSTGIKTTFFNQKYNNISNVMGGSLISELQDKNYYVCLLYDAYFPLEDTLENRCQFLRLARNYYGKEDYIYVDDDCIQCLPQIKLVEGSPLAYLDMDSSDELHYTKVTNGIVNNGTVSFLFKIKSENLNCSIFTYKLNDLYIEFCSKINSNTHICEYKVIGYKITDDGYVVYGTGDEITFSTPVVKDKIHAAIINLYQEGGSVFFEIILDGERKQLYVGTESSNEYINRYIFDNRTALILNAYSNKEVYGLIVDFNQLMPFDLAHENVEKIKKLLFLGEIYKDNFEFCPTGQGSATYFNRQTNYNWFSFKNTLMSNKGNYPISKINSDQCFVFDLMTFGNSYYAYKNRLIYQTELNQVGTIFTKIKFVDKNQNNLIFFLKTTTLEMKLYRDSTNKYKFNINGVTVINSIDSSPDLDERDILLSYKITPPNNISLILLIDGDPIFNDTLTMGSYLNIGEETMKLYIGCDENRNSITNRYDNVSYYYTASCNAIYSDLIYEAKYYTQSDIDNIYKFVNSLNTDKFIDVFGRVYQKRIVEDKKMKMNTRYEYNNIGTSQSKFLKAQKVLFETYEDNFEDANLNRQFIYSYYSDFKIKDYIYSIKKVGGIENYYQDYSYDDLNRIILDRTRTFNGNPNNKASASMSTISQNNYTYNINGQLSRVSKTYKENGSTKYKNINFVYNNKNLLVQAGSKIISYNGLYISSIADQSSGKVTNFTFLGTKLSSISSNDLNMNYFYDYSGKRIKKVNLLTNETTRYFYNESGVLVCEEKDNKKIEYLYDTDLSLIGFNVINLNTNVKTRYFYLRDASGNILEILDNNMNSIGSYFYDAFGNSICSEGNQEILEMNPFRYRGYYYDVETQLFYCNSRYYSPELCCWISPDSIEYLDPESINGLNLYCYCYNNPISYADPSGNLPQWAMWLIGGVVIAGLAIATIATGGAAGGVAGFILSGALKGAVVGAVSGALVNGTIGGISSAIDGGGFWSGFFDGAAHGFMSGAVIGGITGAISSGLQVAKSASYWDKGTFSSGYKSMKYHYTQEVINKGLTKGNSIVKYTSDAVKFANNNGMNFTLNLSRNGLQNSWSLSRYFGSGANGLYTSSGDIITFHYFHMW